MLDNIQLTCHLLSTYLRILLVIQLHDWILVSIQSACCLVCPCIRMFSSIQSTCHSLSTSLRVLLVIQLDDWILQLVIFKKHVPKAHNIIHLVIHLDEWILNNIQFPVNLSFSLSPHQIVFQYPVNLSFTLYPPQSSSSHSGR